MKQTLILLFFIFYLVSCGNIYEEFSGDETNESILYQARLHLSKGEWTEAIGEFQKLSNDLLTTEEIAVEYASAYSGRCGLDFFDLSQALINLSQTPLTMLISNYRTNSLVNFDDCKEAEDILKSAVSTGIMVTERGKYLMAFNSLVKIGVILNFYGDSNNDGARDAGWDPCDGNGATDLPLSGVNEIGTGITLFLNNVSGLTGISNVLGSLTTICTSLPPGLNFCSITSTSGFDNFHRTGIRGVIREVNDGLGLGIQNSDTQGSACEP